MHTEKIRFRLVRTLMRILACLLLPLSEMYADDTRTASLPDLDSLLEAGSWSQVEWDAIGIGIYKTEAHVWFGRETDPLSVSDQ